MSICIGNRLITDIYVGNKAASKAYLGTKLLYDKSNLSRPNLYDPSVRDYGTYIRYANRVLGSLELVTNDSVTATNRCARFACQPSTSYIVSLYMENRFRVASYETPQKGVTLTNVEFDPLDINTNVTSDYVYQERSLVHTTGATDTEMVIFYWTTATNIPTIGFQTIRESITIKTI